MPEKGAYDVAVIGGGSAGLCAAVAAARQGSKTVLIERSRKLGGMGTQALVHTFCGLYEPDISKPPRLANPGLPAQIEHEMLRRTKQSEPTLMGKVYVLLQDPAQFEALARELVEAEENLTVLFENTCEEVSRSKHFEIKTSHNHFSAKAIVDTSADAIAADFLNATRFKSDTPQKSAFVFALQNVGDEAREESFKMRLALDLVRAVQSGTLPPEILGTASRVSTNDREIYFTIDLDDSAQGPELATALIAYLKKHSAPFSDIGLPIFPDVPGVRETYRWLGKHVLTDRELIEGHSFKDTIARAAWPIELRETTKGPRFEYFENPKSSDIPLRSLMSAEIPGVFFAGRCLSATHEALASLRVMGTCFATGQAAGIAASLKAQGITPTAEQVNCQISRL